MTRGEREGSENREGCEEGKREVRREGSRSGTINSVQKKSKDIFFPHRGQALCSIRST